MHWSYIFLALTYRWILPSFWRYINHYGDRDIFHVVSSIWCLRLLQEQPCTGYVSHNVQFHGRDWRLGLIIWLCLIAVSRNIYFTSWFTFYISTCYIFLPVIATNMCIMFPNVTFLHILSISHYNFTAKNLRIWYQNICHCHDHVGRLAYIRSAQM